MFISTLVALAGIALAYRLHYRNRMAAQRLADALEPLTGLIEAKFRVDEIYERAIVEPLRKLGRLCFAVDRFVIDALIFVVALVPQALGLTLKLSTQRGSLQGYALTMVIGLAIVLALVLW
jgi:NADH-quinone oxidoreductase subunit L